MTGKFVEVGGETFFDPMAERNERMQRDICTECGKRPGTITWGDTLAMTHGWSEKRCGVCVYGAQLRHAYGRGIRFPYLLVKFLIAVMRRA